MPSSPNTINVVGQEGKLSLIDVFIHQYLRISEMGISHRLINIGHE